MDSLLRECHINHLLRSVERVRSSIARREQSGMSGITALANTNLIVLEPNDGEFSTFRFGRQFAMVYED
jgi:hypothetical protein